jgi:CubicO group peptidase (beta-lactamase class C family)
MKRISILLLTFFLIHGLQAQLKVKDIDALVQKAQKQWNVPGLSVAIVKDGKIFLSRGYGVLEEGKKEKVNEETLFAIASNTKGFVSSALANLVAEGKLNWDDKVKTYLPYFELYDPYVSSDMTIRDLLSHRAGLGTFSGDAIWYKSELAAEEIVKLAKNVPQAYPFRGGYGSSNLMFITAGEVIKAVTDKPWDSYVSEHFFAPLGMDRSITSTTKLSAIGNAATPHKTQLDKNKPIEWTNWDNMSAAGAIISSSDDMAEWMIMHLKNGVVNGDTLLDPVQQNMLWTLHNNYTLSEKGKETIPGRHFTGYGLGYGLQDYYGRMLVSHGGGYDGMYSRVAMMPDENIGIVILTNSMSGISTPLSYAIFNLFIEEDKQDWIKNFYKPQTEDQRIVKLKASRLEGTSPSLEQAEYAGNYFADMYGDISVIEIAGQLKLYFSHSPDLSATLSHWHNDTYQIMWDNTHAWFDFGLLTFHLDDNLAIKGMKMNVPNGDIFFDEYEIVKKD